MAFPVFLAGIAARVGAPLVAKMLRDNVGGMAGEIAGSVVEQVAGQLGVAPTEDAVTAAYRQSPEAFGAALRQVEEDNAEHWAAMVAQVNETMRAEQTSSSLLQRIWRPVFGLVFSLSFAGTILTLMRAIWTSDVAAINAFASMAGFLIFAFSTGAAVLGVYVWQRSAEKKEGAA